MRVYTAQEAIIDELAACGPMLLGQLRRAVREQATSGVEDGMYAPLRVLMHAGLVECDKTELEYAYELTDHYYALAALTNQRDLEAKSQRAAPITKQTGELS